MSESLLIPVWPPKPTAEPDFLHCGLDAFHLKENWFSHDRRGIHGIGHAARVLVWATFLADWMIEKEQHVDLDVVRCAAVLHDVRRICDGRDPDHGRRCGRWIMNESPAFRHLDEARRSLVAYCCEWHVPPDIEAPAMPLELVCLKDADALDRVRFEGLDARFLRTAMARAIVGQARFLWSISEASRQRKEDPWAAVRTTAMKMGLWNRNRTISCEALRERLSYFRC